MDDRLCWCICGSTWHRARTSRPNDYPSIGVLSQRAFLQAYSEELRSNRRFVLPRNLKQSIEWLTSASTKLRGENAFNDANEVKELTTKFDGKSAELQTLYTRYKVDDNLHPFVRQD